MSLTGSLRRYSALAGVVGAVGALISGCGGGGGSTTPAPGPIGGGTSRDVCLANAPHNDGRKRWTVLIYMNAANNLQPDSLLNVAQMAKVGSDAANVNIVVQWKQSASCQNGADCGTPSFDGTRRYLISPHTAAEVNQIENGNTVSLDRDRLGDPATNSGGTSDMGDYRTLNDFVRWGATTYPADNLAVVLWDHGSGWRSTRAPGLKRAPVFRALSEDDNSYHEIQTAQLPQGLAGTAQPIDMLIVDCSLEQMIEVAYQVRGSAKVMVGSEESPPGEGYPYDAWLGALKTGGANRCAVGSNIVTSFVANYPTSDNITQSVLDLSKMDALAVALDNFANSLRQHINDQAPLLQSAREAVQFYKYPENKDLFHYAALIKAGSTAADLQQSATALQTALTGTGGAVVVSQHGAYSQDNSNGLAIYIPGPGAYLPEYNDLALSRVAHWGAFLQSQTR